MALQWLVEMVRLGLYSIRGWLVSYFCDIY